MNVTATLLGQMLTFVVFVWFIKRYLWEPLITAMEDRSQRIAEGLTSAELGQKKMDQAKVEYKKIVGNAKSKATEVLNNAQQQSNSLIEQARKTAKEEADKIMNASNIQIEQEINQAKEELKNEVAKISIKCAEKIIEKEIDKKKHEKIFSDVVKDL